MLKSLALLTLMIILSFPQFLKLRSENMKRELWIFSLLMILSSGIVVAKGNGINIPNPLDFIAFLLKPIYHFLQI